MSDAIPPSMNDCSNPSGFAALAATGRSQLPDWALYAAKATCNLGIRYDRRPGDMRCADLAPVLCSAPLAGRRAIAEALAAAGAS